MERFVPRHYYLTWIASRLRLRQGFDGHGRNDYYEKPTNYFLLTPSINDDL